MRLKHSERSERGTTTDILAAETSSIRSIGFGFKAIIGCESPEKQSRPAGRVAHRLRVIREMARDLIHNSRAEAAALQLIRFYRPAASQMAFD